MRNPATFVAATLTLLPATSLVEALEITSRQISTNRSTNGYEFVLTNDTTIPLDDARSLIVLAARSTCPGRSLALGAFSVLPPPAPAAGTLVAEPVEFQFTQNINCNIGAPGIAPPPPRLALTAEQRNEIAIQIRTATEAHLRQVAAGRFDMGFRDLDTLNARWESARWRFDREAFRLVAGELENVTITGMTIGGAPQGAQPQEINVTANFMNSYENVAIECGAMTWVQLSDGEFRISSIRRNYVTKQHLETIPDDQLGLVYSWLECR